MKVMTLIITLFLVTNVFALTTEQNDTVNILANRTNITNTTLFILFEYLESTSNETYMTQEQLNATLDQRFNLVMHEIELVNSSVDNQLINTIASFKDAAANESYSKLIGTLNGTISVYDTTVNERFDNIKRNYVPQKELYENYTYNITNMMYANDNAVLNAAYGTSNFDKILMLILFVAAVAIPWKFRKPIRPTDGLSIDGRMLSTGTEKLSIEDMANPEYQKRIREYYNLLVKINKLKLSEKAKEQAYKRAREGTLTLENLNETIEGIKVETYDKERIAASETRETSKRPSKARRKTPK